MKSLVVFYSRTGTTKKVAETISSNLKCDIEEILDKKNRTGVLGYLMSGRDAILKKLVVIEGIKKAPALYDLVIIGTPVWAGTMSSPIRTYISQNKGCFKKVAFFCTHGSSESKSTFRDMGHLCQKKPVSLLELKTKEVIDEGYIWKVKKFVENWQLKRDMNEIGNR